LIRAKPFREGYQERHIARQIVEAASRID